MPNMIPGMNMPFGQPPAQGGVMPWLQLGQQPQDVLGLQKMGGQPQQTGQGAPSLSKNYNGLMSMLNPQPPATGAPPNLPYGGNGLSSTAADGMATGAADAGAGAATGLGAAGTGAASAASPSLLSMLMGLFV